MGGCHDQKSSEPSVFLPTGAEGEDEQEGPLPGSLTRKGSGPKSASRFGGRLTVGYPAIHPRRSQFKTGPPSPLKPGPEAA